MLWWRSAWWWAFGLAALGACTPALDWRQVQLLAIGLEAQFPCRPAALERQVRLAGRVVSMQMHGCAVQGTVYAVGAFTLDDVRDVAAALDALKSAAAANLQATPAAGEAVAVAGTTPYPQAGGIVLAGRRPDGAAVVEHLIVFARGPQVYQASVLGSAPQQVNVRQFFEAMRAV
ncbi:MAG: hypothetical protein HS128_19835 [Ideonella sp.]|nr:hypothetical protein [Ideonella sp.]MCC7457776.1 hypothetical protein [Nitrospira sp.]